MKECGTPDVPSFYALRKLQQKLTQDVGLKPRHHTSSLDNQFYMNHPNDLIRLDFSNPLVRTHLNFYPEVTTTVTESWQAAKWVSELEAEDLTPMWANWTGASHRHFYIKELAQCSNGAYVVPLKWVVYDKKVHAEAYLVSREASGIFTVEEHEIIRVPATDMQYNFLDLRKQGELVFSGVQDAFKPYMPHPTRVIAQGRPVFVLRIMPWADDVSGNRSKQYNAHMNMYLANLNIPHKQLAQEYFVRFCSTSQHSGSLEQFDALSEDCKQDDWSSAYDCELQQEIIFRLGIHLLPADNPQQAETTSTAGSSATYWCREDKSGGSATHRETNEGYHALFSPGTPRKPEETVAKIKEQIRAACRGVATAVEALQTESGVKDKIATHWIEQLIEKARGISQERVFNHDTRDPRLNDNRIKGPAREKIKQEILDKIQEELFAWVIIQPPDRYAELDDLTKETPELRPGDHYNVLLRVHGLDPHRDSPCEILHTILLGEDKYVWHETSKVWNDEQGTLFAARLQSSSIDGLSLPPLRSRYMVQYKKSLIGKHYKALQQLAVFQLDKTLCSPALFELWKVNGVLGALLWYPEIKDMDQYLADLSIAIGNVLDHWAIKYKLHVLPHIPEATEIFDVLSNHQAPSLDIATTLADMERFKNQVSGGWWKPDSGDWTQAGHKIRGFLIGNKQLQRRLGWTAQNVFKPGTVKALSKTKRRIGTWKTVLDLHWNNCQIEPGTPGTVWNDYLCLPGSWVFFANSTGEVMAGRIAKILVPEASSSTADAVVVVYRYLVLDIRDDRLDMPVLMAMNQAVLIKPEDLLFKFNAQHDCQRFSCRLIESAGPRQERSQSKLTQKIISHSDTSRFLINMHALHNAHLIRETLPRHLTAPRQLFSDRCAKHFEFAAALREVGPEKRALTAARGQATKARNKQDKVDRAAGVAQRAS
ncbi:hypothetical protein DFH08DRAFT_912734 [Mycena albidolilacea]|uniref:Uncharacterized protein n=1 Tax=Mycena albidolilacea TaxID=1033008 RepID=A0AAD7ABC3_9AGAR|nr:hypothetical protein DFH08DRAFT_912734 [Mycena albidolilacea]